MQEIFKYILTITKNIFSYYYWTFTIKTFKHCNKCSIYLKKWSYMKDWLSIVIPCLNEEETIWIVVQKWLEFLKNQHLSWEVLVSDNWSSDNSVSIAEKLWARVVICPSKGYWSALIHWFNNAEYSLMIMWDADDSYNFNEISPFLQAYQDNIWVDIVIWNRLAWTIQKWAMPFLHRYLWTPVLTYLLNTFFWLRIWDCNCGMRLITKKAYNELNLKSSWMEFASEMMIKAWIKQMKIVEIPINLYCDKRTREPHLQTRRDWRRHLKYMLLLAPNYLFYYPWIILSIIWILLLLSQIWWSINILWLQMDIHFMILWMTLAIVGHIILVMWLIAWRLAILEWYDKRKFPHNSLSEITLETLVTYWFLLFILWFWIDFYLLLKRFGVAQRDPSLEIRKAISWGYFMTVWLMIVFFAFVWEILQSKVNEYET